MKIKIKSSDISIDCGANVGKYTKHLSKNNSSVYAFEPNPYAFGAISYRFKKFSNVRCINKGVMDREGLMKLYLRKNSSENPLNWSISSSFMTYNPNLDYESNLEIEVIDLCEFIKSLNSRVKVVKMDIEGAEVRILKKLIETDLISKIDYMFVEMHDEALPELRESSNEIRELIKSKNLNHINLDWK